jgi:very-short-patch-repair endonuclease
MADIARLVDELGGMAQKQQLVARGARDLELTWGVRRGEVFRARQGWYSTLPEDDPRVRAVRVGGRLTGLSAIHAWGGWVVKQPPLHVSVHDNAARLRTPWNRHQKLAGRILPGLVVHWDDADHSERGDAMFVGLSDALYRVILDEDLETAVAAVDWALHTGRLDEIDFLRLIDRLPVGLRFIAQWVDPLCESLPESLARTRLRLRGHRVVPQVSYGGLERIDLVVDDVIGLEVDGESYHLDRFEEDREKDLAMMVAGYTPVRPSARAVFHRWELVARAVESALVARGCAPSGLPETAARRMLPRSFQRRLRPKRGSGIPGPVRR